MPFSAIVDNRVFCTHGGLSPELHSLDQIRGIQRPTDVPDTGISMLHLGINQSIHQSIYLTILLFLQTYLGLLTDLLWAYPNSDYSGWGEADRGVSFFFGEDVVEKFVSKFGFQFVCRSHGVIQYICIYIIYKSYTYVNRGDVHSFFLSI